MTTSYVGVPTLSFFPLVNATFKVVKKLEVSVPNSGNFFLLSPEVFREEDGDFELLSKTDKSSVLNLPNITKVLLATGKYPNLGRNQVFTPLSLSFDGESVIIKGSILEIERITAKDNERSN